MESALCYHLLLLPLLSSPHLYSSFLCVWADRDSTVASARGKQWENAQGRTLGCKASRTLCVCFCRACLCVYACDLCTSRIPLKVWDLVQETSACLRKSFTFGFVWSHQSCERKDRTDFHSHCILCVFTKLSMFMFERQRESALFLIYASLSPCLLY